MEFIIRGKRLRVYKLVASYELEMIEIDHITPFVFSIDIYEDTCAKKFFSKVYRREFFRLKPSFILGNEDTLRIESDEELRVEDVACSWSEKKSDSIEDALKLVLLGIEEIFK